MKRFAAVLAVILLLAGSSTQSEMSWEEYYDSGNQSVATIAYIPLDNRPVNTARAVYLAESAGFRLIMPQEDLYRTALDGQPLNANGTQYGDGELLLQWLDSCRADYYVVSIDQILSGGLANSRIVTEITAEYQRIDRLLALLEGKNAVLFDTVMRLAPTVGYMGYTLEEYQTLRAYGALPRPGIPANSTLVQVIVSYEVETLLSKDVVSSYHAARSRKLLLASYLLEKLKDREQIYLYYGIDDSSPQNTVQTNELAWLRQHLTNGQIFAGTDELGLMSIANIIRNHYSQEEIPVNIRYFGADPTAPADEYDVGSLESNLLAHMDTLNLHLNHESCDLEILVLGDAAAAEEVREFTACYQENMQGQKPTILIDLQKDGILARELLLSKNAQIDYLFAYSGWNTAGNSIGIALANGISRYAYLRSGSPVSGANAAFLQGLTFSFAKDISYNSIRKQLDQQILAQGGDTNNFYPQGVQWQKLACKLLNGRDEPLSFENIAVNLAGKHFVTPLGFVPVPKISVTEVTFPWYRSFEADLQISID